MADASADIVFIGPTALELSERLGVTPRAAQRALNEFGSGEAVECAFDWCRQRHVGLDDFTEQFRTLRRLRDFVKRESGVA